MEIGLTTKWMGRVFSDGLMEGNILENIDRTKRKGLATLNGQMEDFTLDNGKTEFSMDMGNSLILMETSGMEFGRTDRDPNGLKEENLKLRCEEVPLHLLIMNELDKKL